MMKSFCGIVASILAMTAVVANAAVPTVITVKPGGGGDFTGVVAAVRSITDSSTEKPYVVQIHEGTYDMIAEYFGAEDFTDSGKVGLVLPRNVDLVGIGDRSKIVLKSDFPDTIKYRTSLSYSTLNLVGYDNRLENLTVTAYNCRYAVHDQSRAFADEMDYRHVFRNCVFIHKGYRGSGTWKPVDATNNTTTTRWSPAHAVGQGYNHGANILFENCVFDARGRTGNAFLTHDCNKPQPAAMRPGRVICRNCEFHSVQREIFYASSTGAGVDQFVDFFDCTFDEGKSMAIKISSLNTAATPGKGRLDYYIGGNGNRPAVAVDMPAGYESHNTFSAETLPDLADVRKRIPELFKGSENTFQCERLWKRLEQAERLQALPERTLLMQAELDEFRRYFKEAIEHWSFDPANPAVKPIEFDFRRDFGAKGDGVADDAPAFAKARAAIAALNGRPSVLRLGAGTFLVGGKGMKNPDGRVANISFNFVTNCLVTGESPEKTKLLFGVYEAHGISLLGSCNVTVAKVDCRWKERPFAQTVLESYNSEEATAVVRWTPGTLRPDDPRYRRSDHAQVICVFAADGKKIIDPGATMFFDLKADDLGDNRFRIYFDRKRAGYKGFRAPPGSYLILPDRDNRFQGTTAAHSEFCTFSEVWFRNARSGAVNGGHAHYFTGWKLKTMPEDGPAIVFSSNADTFYCSRGSYLAHSEFHHMCDDGANSLGYGTPIVRIEGPRTFVPRGRNGRMRVDDVVQIMDVMTGRFRADLKVVKVENFNERNGTPRWRVTVDRDLPPGIVTIAEAGEMDAKTRYAISHGLGKVPKAADLLYAPLQFGTGFTVFDNRIHDLRGCGINVQCPHSLVESNVIERVSLGMKMTGLTEWFEGTPPADVVVRNNVFRECGTGIVTRFDTINAKYAEEKPIRFLEIRDNVFENVRRPLSLNNVSDSVVQDVK